MSGPSDAQKAVETFRQRVATLENRATMDVIRAYRPVFTRLQRDTRALVVIAQEQGLKPWQVMRMKRLRDLERQYLRNVSQFADTVGDSLTGHQRAAVGLARDATRQTVAQGIPNGVTMANLANIGLGWNELPDDAFQNFVGIAGDGAPLGDLLRESVAGDVPRVKEAIGEGIALGKGPRETAELVRVAGGMPLSRALVITRTETNRAYREATRLQYANNSQVVKGYRRNCAKDDTTCLACIALDGELYALDEPLNEHPNGRCALIPEVIDYHDLGLDMPETPRPPNARDWLSNQSEDVQRNILGDTRFDAWKSGDIQLNQLASVKRNPVWGDTAVVRPIRDIQTASGQPLQQAGAPPSALRRTPTPRAPRVAPDGDLVDPQTNLPVRGTRTTPPEPTLPREWVAEFGDPDDFLDIGPMGADPAFIKYRGATGRDAIISQVKEQEAWARAVGGAVEVDYTGLSIKAARDVNLAIERTVLRHKMRPLDRVATGPYSAEHPFGSNVLAYQVHGNVHINLQNTVNGSVRGYRDGAARSQRRSADKLQQSQSVAELEADIASKRSILESSIADDAATLERMRAANVLTEAQLVEQERLLNGRRLILRDNEKAWKKMMREHKAEMDKIQSGQWATYHGVDANPLTDLITHEIGHYAHRRYGFYDVTSLDTLATKTRVTKTVRGRKVWKGSYKPKPDAGKISEYAMTNDHEFFAEAWADYHISNGARLTKKVRTLIEDVIEANAHFPDIESGTQAHTINLGVRNRVRKGGG